ncbi:PEP-CTERM sorting domain-containing protein [endosymbiont of Lamellibrachia barhami]|uniref:PEP-CTERM sorting domain-containing protein n=1 Tax=endosymbiont of Lamellibrachia barhami TaxID=205975 RepID=UPI0034E25056
MVLGMGRKKLTVYQGIPYISFKVPEPGIFWFFCFAFASLGIARRKRNNLL